MRNFLIGSEKKRGIGKIRWLEKEKEEEVKREEMRKIGIDVRDKKKDVGKI